MNIRPEHLDALCHLGYTGTEASFLYLVAMHSGYFTQRQFLAFAQVRKDGLASRLTAKALECKHLRVAQGAYHTHVYNLYSRRLYGAIRYRTSRKRQAASSEIANLHRGRRDCAVTRVAGKDDVRGAYVQNWKIR